MQQFDNDYVKIGSEKPLMSLKIDELDKCSMVLQENVLHEHLKKQLPGEIEENDEEQTEVSHL